MDKLDEKQCAFVLRIAPSFKDAMDEALQNNEIIIGWAEAEGLLDRQLEWKAFREILHRRYYSDRPDYRGSGNAAGHMWRFIRKMKEGDLVVVPHGDRFFVARITGEVIYDKDRVADDRAYRRRVTWLNSKEPIPRGSAHSPLQLRMKNQGTVADATDLVAEIRELLLLAEKGDIPTFEQDLHRSLVSQTLKKIRTGRIGDYGFERLIESVLISLGGTDVQIIPRQEDKGGDLRATFLLAQTIPIVLVVQAKHFEAEPPVAASVVDEVVRGIEDLSGDVGMVITSGTLSDEAFVRAESIRTEQGTPIGLMDGEQLATLIIDQSLARSVRTQKRVS